ncbi:hypothetical protein DPMN_098604 [Dreissena polymorpha]|uniref:HTH CENPB-type domain-containing protein n=1 Tax=Dreissena polymorpha TaxID=45954 RepID=A0A9D4LDX5_DREPO|nr:hypothetical protein DPMN_098604 [Dreissena polymorpha]
MRWRFANGKGQYVYLERHTILTRVQEEILSQHCVSMAHLGYGFSRWQILDMALNMAVALGIENEPTKHWFYGFLKRFPDVNMVHPAKREKARDAAVTNEMIKNYLKELELT